MKIIHTYNMTQKWVVLWGKFIALSVSVYIKVYKICVEIMPAGILGGIV